MAELLLELFSEEIPARMQLPMAEHLKSVFEAKISENKLPYSKIQAFVTPRRVTISIDGMALTSEDVRIEKRGPRFDANPAALDGFLKSNNVTKEELTLRNTDKGEFYFLIQEQKGRPTKTVVSEIINSVLPDITWPKSMRWASHDMRWVRPLKSIVAVFGGEVLPVRFGHVEAGNQTFGHRFLGRGAFRVESLSQYKKELNDNKVVLDTEERKKIILEQAEKLAREVSCILEDDPKLLEEVAGLVEWPIVLRGHIDSQYMHLPEEVLISTIRANQKYLCMRDSSGAFAPYFLVVSNMITADGGKQIVAGNERVLRARLSDARFFWNQDIKMPLLKWAEKLERIVFHPLLGNMSEKTDRLKSLAKLLSVWISRSDIMQAEKAASLCKADLASGMVGEFPELQGVMGRYYAYETGEISDVADAIAEHYSPQGPNDACPSRPESIAVALADKIDTLAGMFAINEKPSGSKDPFGLRRSALGIIRIIIENKLSLPLEIALEHAVKLYPSAIYKKEKRKSNEVVSELLEFFMDRLKAQLKIAGFRHDIISAVLGSESCGTDLLNISRRVCALTNLLDTEEGKNLLAAYKRAANIVGIEEKKDKAKYEGDPSSSTLIEKEELFLLSSIEDITDDIEQGLESAEYEKIMKLLAGLRVPIDNFFEKIVINCEDASLRKHRLRLLSKFKMLVDEIADFGVIEG